MRLSLAVPTVAGLLLAWAVAAQADAPPAAPIFYCPAKAAAAPAKTPAKPAGPTVAHASAPRGQGCPTKRVATPVASEHHHHWRRAETLYALAAPPRPRYVPAADVSAAQAFIYRYELARHGLDARAADEAWAEGRRGPPMIGERFLAQREVPPPPCPRGCPGPEAWRNAGPPPMMAQQRPMPPPPPIPAPPPRAYAWQDRHAGGGYSEERSEGAGGWSYSEQDGQGRYRHWGDHFAGEPAQALADRGDDHRGYRGDHWADAPRRGPCPPSTEHACTAGGHGQAEVYETAGRDAAGFLTWPGKTTGW